MSGSRARTGGARSIRSPHIPGRSSVPTREIPPPTASASCPCAGCPGGASPSPSTSRRAASIRRSDLSKIEGENNYCTISHRAPTSSAARPARGKGDALLFTADASPSSTGPSTTGPPRDPRDRSRWRGLLRRDQQVRSRSLSRDQAAPARRSDHRPPALRSGLAPSLRNTHRPGWVFLSFTAIGRRVEGTP